MQRGLPVSILVHVIAIAMVFAFGSHVTPKPLEMPRVLDMEFSMVTLPKEESVEPDKAELDPDPEVQAPAVEPEIEPAVVPEKPKDIPEEKEPKEEKEPVKEPVKVVKEPVSEPLDVPVEKEPDLPVPALTAFGVSGTDVDFPFAYYLNIVKNRVSKNFTPSRGDFRKNAVISCALHFNISRSGSISQITVERSSGIDVFDRAARRAVLSSNPLPKLPAKYTSSSLGITFVFNLESGL